MLSFDYLYFPIPKVITPQLLQGIAEGPQIFVDQTV
jgi:hypothetical protein